jgi:hypothetical protein
MLLGFINPTLARLASERVAGRLTLLRSRGKLGICDKGEGYWASTDSLDKG